MSALPWLRARILSIMCGFYFPSSHRSHWSHWRLRFRNRSAVSMFFFHSNLMFTFFVFRNLRFIEKAIACNKWIQMIETRPQKRYKQISMENNKFSLIVFRGIWHCLGCIFTLPHQLNLFFQSRSLALFISIHIWQIDEFLWAGGIWGRGGLRQCSQFNWLGGFSLSWGVLVDEPTTIKLRRDESRRYTRQQCRNSI